jgi:hypothetical protein
MFAFYFLRYAHFLEVRNKRAGVFKSFPPLAFPSLFPFLSQSSICLIVSRLRAYLNTDQQVKLIQKVSMMQKVNMMQKVTMMQKVSMRCKK